ncbi:MAG: hypothetical protein ACJATI_001303 [Halioglobus sp.]|jgi:hypothetical protein
MCQLGKSKQKVCQIFKNDQLVGYLYIITIEYLLLGCLPKYFFDEIVNSQ